MNNLLDIKSPAQAQAAAFKSDYGLDNVGLTNLRQTYWNLPTEALYEEVVFRSEAQISHQGPLVVRTGCHTGRSPSDKTIVREATSENAVWWGQHNRPFAPDGFDGLFNRVQGFFQGRDVFVQDCYLGADPEYRVPIRIVAELAWHSLFARNMFLLPKTDEEYRLHIPEFTVIVAPSFKSIPQIDQTATNTFVALRFDQGLCLIGNTAYAGEIKRSVFTNLNYCLPLQGVMPMHCSANQGPGGDVAVFFGLPGTGRTTLCADPRRALIGDDEHGWSDNGVFNLEGGCYSKVHRLSSDATPQICAATRRFGTLLENVVCDPVTRVIDLDDGSITENSRASYPLEYIGNALSAKRGGHPKNVVLLTCDASGAMPPIARLTPAQAVYQFISGYTSKLAGTEDGPDSEPEITFSTCFGGPFMVHHPSVYAELLYRKIVRYGVTCWLINTGWIGGPYGVGERISIRYSRAMLNAALSGDLLHAEYAVDPLFGFEIPKTCPDVPSGVLNPAHAWPNRDAYLQRYRGLVSRFIDNFARFQNGVPAVVVDAGPHL
ncbi:MAG: phosphoenolpyruvate carboxykinase (ATP) [Chloroflexi bacterium]|nr:phosphoenolpyruvate carboxykinase (ATP) [Chloroflexota bacterium]